MDLVCLNCNTALMKIKGGYSCPQCHSLYTPDMKLIWDATSKHKNQRRGNGNKEV